MTPRIGELFAGYGGLGMGVQAVFGGEVAWYSEIDKGALKILEHRFPGVPNVGDVTTADWSQVEPVDILTGGSPCQDLSHAGKRAGMTEGTRSNLWVAMREAIAQLRPPIVVWENVRGAYSAAADSEVEPCAGCVGDGPGVHLRALGRVLGDLSELGYDARWHGVRASDLGAPHGRFRVFVVAHPQHAQLEGVGQLSGFRGRPDTRPDVLLLPTPDTGESISGHGRRGGRVGNGRQSGASLENVVTLLPTPVVTDAPDVRDGLWGDYAAAVARWEEITRPAPAPTVTSKKGTQQLSPAFVEWMMGLPAGWVTDTPGITRNEALKALGNGVVPQQCAAALRAMLAWEAVA